VGFQSQGGCGKSGGALPLGVWQTHAWPLLSNSSKSVQRISEQIAGAVSDSWEQVFGGFSYYLHLYPSWELPGRARSKAWRGWTWGSFIPLGVPAPLTPRQFISVAPQPCSFIMRCTATCEVIMGLLARGGECHLVTMLVVTCGLGPITSQAFPGVAALFYFDRQHTPAQCTVTASLHPDWKRKPAHCTGTASLHPDRKHNPRQCTVTASLHGNTSQASAR
jgi:hypothetical protein